jgi:TonB family protein
MAEPAPNSVAKGADRSERRKKPRKSATNLSLVTVEMDPNGFGLMLDVSESGAGVQVMNRIEPGTNVQIAFKLPEVDSQIEGSGVITWCDGHGRVGVEFQQLKDQSSQQLKQWINSLPESFLLDEPAFPNFLGESSGEEHLKSIRAELAALKLDTNATLQFILDKLVDHTHSNGGAIALGERDRMVCRASTGLAPDAGVVIGSGSALTAECLRTGKIVRCEDTEIDVRVDEEICRELNLRSSVIVPILYQGRMRGVLEVFSPVPNAFNDQHVDLLEHSAEFAAELAFGSKGEYATPPIQAPKAPPKAEPVVEIKKPAPEATEKTTLAKPEPTAPQKKIAVVPSVSPTPTKALPLASSSIAAAAPRTAFERLPAITDAATEISVQKALASSPEIETIIDDEPSENRWKLSVILVIVALVVVMAGLGWLYKAFGNKPAAVNPAAPAGTSVTQPQTPATQQQPAAVITSPPQQGSTAFKATVKATPQQSTEKSIVADDTVQGRNITAAYRDQSPLVIMPSGKPARRDDSPAEAPSIAAGSSTTVNAINLPGSIVKPELQSQGNVTGGRLLYRVEPIYPQFAKQQRVQGNVVLSGRVLKDGSVDHIKRVSGSPLLENAALAAVRQWKYEPYKLNGQPQEVDISITVQFRLK